jgi:carbon-monoxide dehydrogenase medium subunit
VIPDSFDYYAPTSVEEAIGLLQQHGDDAKILAGGHSLIPLMKLRLAAPQVLIDLSRVSGLNEISEEDGTIVVGALCTHAQIADSPIVQGGAPALSAAAGQIGDQQVRNVGTIGGNLAHADPASDLPAVVLAFDAELVATGPAGQRSIPASSFFQGLMMTSLGEDEILTSVRIPSAGAGSGSSYAKCENPASRYAIVGVSAVVNVSDGVCSSARIGVTGAGAVAVRATAAEGVLAGSSLDDATIAAAADAVPGAVNILGDIHASAEYRTELLKIYTRRAIAAAAEAA